MMFCPNTGAQAPRLGVHDQLNKDRKSKKQTKQSKIDDVIMSSGDEDCFGAWSIGCEGS